MEKIGIFGGTFDPIHKGHIALAACALDEAKLDRVLFMPTHINWMKKDRAAIKDLDRIKMIELSIEGHDSFGIEKYEINKGGISYTYETLTVLKRKYDDAELYFIMGEDSLDTFPEWKKPEVILENATLLVAPRNEGNKEDLTKKAKEVSERFGGNIIPLKFEKVNISSTDIRDLALNDPERLKDHLDKKVVSYIKKNDLYKKPADDGIFSTDSEEMVILRKKVKKALERRRYVHTLGVAYTAASLAMAHNADIKSAYIAGLLHDCAKSIPNEKKLELAEHYDINLSKAVIDNPDLLHAELGSFIIKDEYGIEDEDIINAVRYHTTGREEMSLLEKIIYLADYIEPNRKKILGITDVRSAAFKDIDKAMVIASENVLKHLEHIDATVDPISLKCNEYYKMITG